MKVFLKYIFKNMTEKKGRFLLLIFSITVSTALFVFSLGAVDVILNGYEDTLKNAADGKDIGISSNTEDVFFTEEDFKAEGLTDFEGMLIATGVINKDDEITYVNFTGKKDCSKYVQEGSMPENSFEPVCAISDRTAKDRDLKIGDTIDVSIAGAKHTFTIKAICAPSGSYYADGKEGFTMVVPYDYMETVMNSGGRYNYMTAETDKDSVDAAGDFNEVNERVKATSLTDLSSEKEMTQSTVTTFYLMFAIVCIICCIIIHGAFKLIINERMTVIGTFMSQGATRKKIESILLWESFLYSLFGAIFGVALGEVILYFVSRESSPLKEYGIYMSFNIDPKLIIIGIIFAVLMSIISALMPARSVRKLPVKDVILNRMEVKHKNGSLRMILGMALLAFAIAGAFINAEWVTNLSVIFTAAAFLGMILLLRKLLKIISGILAKIFRKNMSLFLAFNNVKTSKLLRGNITLLVISFSAVLLIASLGMSLAAGVVGCYEKLNYNYSISHIIDNNLDVSTTDIIIDKLNSLDCVDKNFILPQYNVTGLTDNNNTVYITGADPLKYAEFNEYLELKSAKYYTYINELATSDENSAIITDFIAKKSGKHIGDFLEVEVNKKKVDLKIIGIYDGKLFDNGRMIIVKPETIKKQFNVKEATSIAFNIIGDANNAEKEFKVFLSSLGATYRSNKEMMEENKRSNQEIVDILSIFAIIALVVASIGVFNNITISFQQRKKEFAVMSSIGMNAKKRKKLVFAENMYCVVMSIALSIPFTLLLNKLISKVMITLNIPLTLTFDWSSVPMYSAILAAVIFIASLSTMKKSKKINVVQELKYE